MVTNKQLISKYEKPLNVLYKKWILPILNGEEEMDFVWSDKSGHLTMFDINSSSCNTLERCSYKAYEEFRDDSIYSTGTNPRNRAAQDAVGYKHMYLTEEIKKPILNEINKLVNVHREETGIKLRRSSAPNYYAKYKDCNGYMGWHTNCLTPGDRYYFVYNTDNNSSFIRYIDQYTEEMITVWEPKGWSLNHFVVGDCSNPFWHCIYSNTHRFSFGMKLMVNNM